MYLNDRIYGRFKISSPVIIELIRSKPMQRLKKINQFGVPAEYYYAKGYSRFEHSIGVMLLLKSLGASEEEQVAGLLHDVSHTAFSHVIDWVIGEGDLEEFQDNKHEDFILKGEISKILEKHQLSPKKILDYKEFKLLEQPTPHLCADRVDYSLREFPLDTARKCFSGLIVSDYKIVCKNKKIALLLARSFLDLQRFRWGSFEGISRYKIFGFVLRIALQQKVIKFEDFWKEDKYVIDRLKNSRSYQIKILLSILRKRDLSSLPKSDQLVNKKFRYINPYVNSKNELALLSNLNKKFKQEIEQAKKENNLGTAVPDIGIMLRS